MGNNKYSLDLIKAVKDRNFDHLILSLDECDIENTDARGRTALHHAAMINDERFIKELIEKGAKVDAKDRRGRTPLHRAARSGMFRNVKILLDEGNANPNARDNMMRTPLHEAALRNDLEMFMFIAEYGGDLHAVSKIGGNMLHYCARGLADQGVGRDLRIIRWLLRVGLPYRVKGYLGKSVREIIFALQDDGLIACFDNVVGELRDTIQSDVVI